MQALRFELKEHGSQYLEPGHRNAMPLSLIDVGNLTGTVCKRDPVWVSLCLGSREAEEIEAGREDIFAR